MVRKTNMLNIKAENTDKISVLSIQNNKKNKQWFDIIYGNLTELRILTIASKIVEITL